MRSDLGPGVAVVGLVTGSAGLGKTTFTVRAAHAVRRGFPDGVFFVDLFGMSQRPLPVDDALALLLGALGVAAQQVPADTHGRASLYRSLLRERRVLVLLDNAASEEQVRPLLPAGGAARVLVTSRRLLSGLEGVRRLVLGPLQLPEATELLTGILGERSATDGEPALTRLAQLCGGLPLALRIIGNRLVSRPDWGADELARRLADEERRLEQFRAGDLKIANAFGMSYEQLAPAARRIFRRLAVVPGRDVDAALAAVAGGTSAEDAWDALDDLVDLGLLQDTAEGRYRFHDLVRLFARDRLQREETAAERAALAERTTSWLLRTATAAGAWFGPADSRPEVPDAGLAGLAPLASAEEADEWLRAGVDNWLGALRLAAEGGRHTEVLDCAESMGWYSERWVHGPHWNEVFTLGAMAAAALGDHGRHAAQLNHVAWVHGVQTLDAEAVLRCTAEAMDLAARSGATAQIAWAHCRAVPGYRLLGRLDEAAASASRAAEMFKGLGDTRAYCSSLVNLGLCRRDQGRHEEALESLREVVALAGAAGSGMTPGTAAFVRRHALAPLGGSLALLGRRAEAVAALTEATAPGERLDPSHWQAGALEQLAALLAEEGRDAESRLAYERAALMFETLGDADAHHRCAARATAAP
ncbi:tetratricopeptide repeat protein [Streptomyces hyaluromycini]|uniref:tetratricopeptide repeat protein n=1 Tax=Streptomyces hyaluromycini TaxID=1377993 RepID=UPI000B5CCBAE|nr:tetratricopeptide repeat protein [Streptomyces hyaluromycini]